MEGFAGSGPRHVPGPNSVASPLVSVVVPAYNAERTVAATLGSVLSQTVKQIDVIVVDDGSHDRTAEVADATGDPRVRVLSQGNAGAAAARNTGLAAAEGRYVAFVDADDLWLPRKLERQLAVLEGRSDVTAVQSGVLYVDDALTVLSVRACVPWKDRVLDTLMFRNLPAFPSTVVFLREALEELGGFDPSLVILEDWSLAVEAAMRCNLESVEEPLALYRVHPGNRSRDLGIHVEPGHRVLARVFADPNLPRHVRDRKSQVYARFFAMLSGGALQNRQWPDVARWGAKAALTDPRTLLYMVARPARRIRRRRGAAEYAETLNALRAELNATASGSA